MIKAASAGEVWFALDDKRNAYNPETNALFANSSQAEYVYSYGDFVSNGFKLRNSGNGSNSSGVTYIYMAFAENPFKYSNAR